MAGNTKKHQRLVYWCSKLSCYLLPLGRPTVTWPFASAAVAFINVADNSMKTVFEVFRVTIAIGLGILGSIAIGFFGLLIYDKNKGVIGVTLTVLVGLIAMYVGYQIYRTARRRGILAFITTTHASPDMDNLEPSGDSEVRKVNVKEYVALVENKKSFFKGGSIRIWGDWQERNLDQRHLIKDARYEESERLLLIQFKDESQVSVWNPQIITESPTYLKILKADKVKWEWLSDNKSEKMHFDYFIENKRIRTETNTDWKGDKMDVLLGEPALMMSK